MDEPTTLPARRTESGYTPDEVRSGLRWVLAAWVPGAMFFGITMGAAFTSFLTKFLHVGDLGYGVIMAAGPAASLFLFLGSYAVERTGRAKRNFVVFVATHRLLWLAMAAVPCIFPSGKSLIASAAVGIIAFVAMAVANYGNAGWYVWMSALVPKSIAGAFFGQRMAIGLVSMVVASSGVSWLIDRYEPDGRVYVVIFGVAAILGAIDVFCFTQVPEVQLPVEGAKTGIVDILAIPWRHSLFRQFAVYSAIAFFSYNMIGAFVWPFCFDPPEKHGLGMGLPLANLLIVVMPQLTMALMSPLWGRAIDRFGPKPVLGAGSIMAIVVPAFWLLVHRGGGFTMAVWAWVFHVDTVWLVPVIMVAGAITWPAIEQGILYVQMKGFPEDKRSAYIAGYQVVLGLGAMAGSSFGGVCAAFWEQHMRSVAVFPSWFSHYQPVFLISVLLRLAAFVFLFTRLKLPGVAEYHEVARSVAAEAKASVPRLVTRRGRPRR